MDDAILKILTQVKNKNLSINSAKSELLTLFNNTPHSFGIVRWYGNEDDDVVCINREKAQEYVEKYNKLVGEEVCYVDEDIWLPLKEA